MKEPAEMKDSCREQTKARIYAIRKVDGIDIYVRIFGDVGSKDLVRHDLIECGMRSH
jgi:hypothetical protein